MMNLSKAMIPITLIGPLFATALGAGGSYMVTKAKVEEIAATQAEQHEDVEKLKDQRADQSERLKGVETELRSVVRTLERVDRKIERVLEIPVRSGQPR